MASKISYLKGVRTRYRNILAKEVDSGRSILQSDTEQLISNCTVNQLTTCIEKLKLYSDKLEMQTEKLVNVLEDSEEEYFETLLEKDSVLTSDAIDCYMNLQQMKDQLIKTNVEEGNVKGEHANTEQVFRIQQNMQAALFEYIEQQQSFFERQEKRESEKEQDKRASSSVRLPTLDCVSFDGNKMRWKEFWDSFVSAIHSNERLTNIEKFNYLKAKVHGEAAIALSGISLSHENYHIAIETLRERFGNTQEVIDLHYNELIRLTSSGNTTKGLRCFLDKVNKHLRCLAVLSQEIDQAVFVSIIKSKLPQEVLLHLTIQLGITKEWTTTKLIESLSTYVSARERSETTNTEAVYQRSNEVKGQHTNRSSNNTNKGKSRYSNNVSGEALTANEKSEKSYYNHCRYCEKEHWSDECPTYKTIKERKDRIKGSCYKCLKVGHVVRDCRQTRRCAYCGDTKVHHRSLCPTKFGHPESTTQLAEETCMTSAQQPSNQENTLMSSNEMVLMQTAKAEIKNPNGPAKQSGRVLLDSGSQRTYITSQLAKKLGLKGEQEQTIKLVTFGSNKPAIIKTKVTSICIKPSNGSFMTLSANIVPVISGTVSCKTMKIQRNSHLDQLLSGLQLADDIPQHDESSTIDLLIGNDYYLDIILPQKVEAQPGLYLLSSKLGWILSGRTDIPDANPNSTSMLIMTHGTNITRTSEYFDVDPALDRKPDIADFWNIESIGIKNDECDSGDEKAIFKFKETLKYENGRYQVTWPWIEDTPDLPVNRGLAMGRLRSVVSKLRNKPDLLKQYRSVIQDQIDKGVVEKVTSTSEGPVHYLPHHAVVNPLKPTTKLRIVYDASAKSNVEDNSLNDCLHRGPVMLNDLIGILLRFRLHKIAVIADIEKAFLQVGLQQSQRGSPTELISDNALQFKTASANLGALWKKGQKLLNSFWKIWRSEYLMSLRERSQSLMSKGRTLSSINPQIGNVVLIKDDLPRGSWRIGRIVTLRQSTDGNVRSAEVRLSSGRVLRRPLNLLFPLESSLNLKENEIAKDRLHSVKNLVTRHTYTRNAALEATQKIKQIFQDEQNETGNSD